MRSAARRLRAHTETVRRRFLLTENHKLRVRAVPLALAGTERAHNVACTRTQHT